MIYICRRCGFRSHIKTHLKRHFENRKKPCKALFEDIDIDTLKLQLDTKVLNCNPYVNPTVNALSTENKDFTIKNNTNLNIKGKYLCKYCNLEFSTRQSKYRHELKYCSIKKEKDEENEVAKLKEQIAQKDKEREAEIALKEAEIAQKDKEREAEIALIQAQKDKEREAEIALKEAEIAQKEAEIAQKEKERERDIAYLKILMEDQKEFLMNHIETLMKNAGNNNNNTDNSTNIENQINIHINGFGKEDLSYITDRHFREWFNGPFSAIPNLIEYIHFNPKKPENWNAKIPDDKTSKALIYNAEKEMWVKREKKEVINDMVEKSYNMLDTNFEIQKEAKTLDEKGKRKFENFMKIYDKGNKQLDKRYETEIREKLMNFREYHR